MDKTEVQVPEINLIPNKDKLFPSFINPSNAKGPKHKDATIFETHLNPVMLVFIR